jgi:superfamily I DNA/RNA helicase
MRSLEHARRAGAAVRAEVGLGAKGLEARLRDYVERKHGRWVTSVPADTIGGSRGEVRLGDPLVRYDEALDADPAERIYVVAHEVGHLEQHHRLTDASIPPDPLLGTTYTDAGAPGVARYSERGREEAEANAFAAEFLCPIEEARAEWLAGATASEIAAHRGIPLRVVQAQLAESLFRLDAPIECAGGAGTSKWAPTQKQLDAAGERGRPVLVDAGPGTGKTRTLVLRIAQLLASGVPAREILVLTFSNEAAAELRERVTGAFEEAAAAELEICTFHAWGYVFLHHFRTDAGLPEDGELHLLDDTGRAELVGEVLSRADAEAIIDLRDPQETAGLAAEAIGYLKDRLVLPEDLADSLSAWQHGPEAAVTRAQCEALLSVYRAYEAERAARGAVDFGDLIALSVRTLQGNDGLRAKVREKHRWVLVDEYQDVSRAVSALLQGISGAGNPPWVVGDKRQAIYRFRGAHPENMDRFEEDFPGSARHVLDVNYRSNEAVVAAANHLAALLENPDAEGPFPPRWRANRDQPPADGSAIAVAAANSDGAERAHIAATVGTWHRDHGVPLGEIAVLARRNVDVREIARSLGASGIRAVTSGVVTAEGAAGDLAAVVSLLDAPRAALPRLVYALFRGRMEPGALNGAVRVLLERLTPGGEIDPAPIPGAEGVAETIAELQAEIAPHGGGRHDAWEVLCAFLFGRNGYLRERVQCAVADPDAALAVEEVAAVLGAAAAHRYAHPVTRPRHSRVGFGERLRGLLGRAKPTLSPPPPRRDAVRVMTCHASKGLQFPYVIVAGQTLPGFGSERHWLPPALQPPVDDDRLQADALLFVGVTRAERAVVVSYAASAGGTDIPRYQRERPGLLTRWAEHAGVTVLEWHGEPDRKPFFRARGLWGGALPRLVSTYVASGSGCAIRTYLQQSLSSEFPTVGEALWPAFVGMTRRAMQEVARRANAAARQLTAVEALAVLDEEWADMDGRDHPLMDVYRRAAERRVARWNTAWEPVPGADDLASNVVVRAEGEELLVRTDVLAYFRAPGGRRVAVAMTRRIPAARDKQNAVKWSDYKEQQLAFSLLEAAHDGPLDLYLYGEEDGALAPASWSRSKDSSGNVRGGAGEVLGRGLATRVEATVTPFRCGTCAHRVHCPHWLGAGEPVDVE